MKNRIQANSFSLKLIIVAAIFIISSISTTHARDVCSQGVGIPPFLSAGASPNLLMLFDNSGSMLDMAYKDNIGDDSFCFDDTYMLDEDDHDGETIDPNKTYAGIYEVDTWYVWTAVDPFTSSSFITNWEDDHCYAQGDVVLDNAKLWKAVCASPNCDSNNDGKEDGCKSSGKSVFDDNDNGGLVWADYFDWPEWKEGNYDPGEIVKYHNQLFICTGLVRVTDNDSDKSPVLNHSKWEAIDHTWRPIKFYNKGDIVTYNGMIFEANANHTSSATGLFDDRVIDPTGALRWNRIDEGYFEEYSKNGTTPCSKKAKENTVPYTHSYKNKEGEEVVDMEIILVDARGKQVADIAFAEADDDPDDPATYTNNPKTVLCFAAKGNFLNWATSSRFDIQKEILTGGKYHAGYENMVEETDPVSGKGLGTYIEDHTTNPQTDTEDDRLISEHRGCAGKSFTKQVTLDFGEDKTAGTEDDIKLTFQVHGSTEDDWIDTTDDTTRIEILNATVGGFDNSACQAVVDRLDEGDEEENLNALSKLINKCLGEGVDKERDALNHGLQYCDKLRDPNAIDRDMTTIVGDCESLYKNPESPVSPATIDPRRGVYACYGVFDATTVHDDREGYMGRCWTVPASPGCYQSPCPNSKPTPNYYSSGDKNYMCAKDGKVYMCDGNYNSKQNTCNEPWTAVYTKAPDYSGTCPPDIATAGWSDEIDGDPLTSPDGKVGPGNKCNKGTPDEGVNCVCIKEAMDDFCKNMSVPEVIDPSDIASSTIAYLGLPGSLIDSGVAIKLGSSPLAVYKGYLKYPLPEGDIPGEDDQHKDIKERPDGPRGILYTSAQGLRVGAMAFKDNGSDYECSELERKCSKKKDGVEFDVCLEASINKNDSEKEDECNYCTKRESVIKFCPENNGDGAEVISNIGPIMKIDDAGTPDDPKDDFEVWKHYTSLRDAINKTRANSWTPLGEALYNALGYYGQKADICLTPDPADPDGCADFDIEDVDGDGTAEHPGANPVEFWCQDNNIMIITEGASTADINKEIEKFVRKKSDDDEDTGTCSNGLDGSTYLDDLSYFGAEASATDLFATPKIDNNNKLNIRTHIVVSGSLGDYKADDECKPATLMQDAAINGGGLFLRGENPSQLERDINRIFSDILSRASAGSAASVISSSRSGSGAVYQAIFWPELTGESYNDSKSPPEGNSYAIEWVGDVHSLFIDSNGFLFEDTNGDGQLNPSEDLNHNNVLDTNDEDENGNGILDVDEDDNDNGILDVNEDADNNGILDGEDYRIVFYFSDKANRARSCLNVTEYFYTGSCPDDPEPPSPDCSPDIYNPDADTLLIKNHCKELRDISYIWSAAESLMDLPDANIEANRSIYLDDNGRYIFTWQDLDNDGIVDEGEQMPFEAGTLAPAIPLDVAPEPATDPYFGSTPSRGSVVDDFDINTSDKVESFIARKLSSGFAENQRQATRRMINWVRGLDYLLDEDTGAKPGVAELDDVDLDGDGVIGKKLRSRQYPIVANPIASKNTVDKTWRLGDIIHSTPTVVARPPEAYHFIYKDPSYAAFADRYAHRRQVVYFGANDGMMHAINAGFYEEATQKFWKGYKTRAEYEADKKADSKNDTWFKDTGPELGTELWSYIPYNLIPHLQCMANTDYEHKFYVDQQPRIFDAQLFADDCKYSEPSITKACENANYPGGWGTILVGSFRFGGAPMEAHEINGFDGAPEGESVDERIFGSVYFVMDITNPDQPPFLLGEMTMLGDVDGSGNNVTADLGYSTPSPTVVVMREENGATRWYLIMGNGPERQDGTNNKRGKIAIFPMEWFLGTTSDWSWDGSERVFSPKVIDKNAKRAFRIPDSEPGLDEHQSKSNAGVYYIPGVGNESASFVSDLITVDYDIENQNTKDFGGLYRSDAVYFGTVDGSSFAGGEGSTYWDGGGRLFRMVTKKMELGKEVVSVPYEWSESSTSAGKTLQNYSDTYADGRPTLLFSGKDISQRKSAHNLLVDALAPIVGAPSVGYDGNNFWIYFGTGRFFDKKDKADKQANYFFGVREPALLGGNESLTCDDFRMAWTPITDSFGDLWDVESHDRSDLDLKGKPGQRGLLQTDDMIISEYASSVYDIPFVECRHCVEDPNDSEGDGDFITCGPSLGNACFPTPLNDPTHQVEVLDRRTDPPTKTTAVSFKQIQNYNAGTSCDTGVDGWFRKTHESRERHLGKSTLLGGMLTYTGYQPFSDVCLAEGRSYLYGVHFQTGTAWYENVFGTYKIDDSKSSRIYVKEKLSLGRGMSAKATLHVGSGDNAATAFVQTSTGDFKEIGQENLPIKNTKSGRISWSGKAN